MPITINGTGTITGISAGGLPDAIITTAEVVDLNITPEKLSQKLTSGTAVASTSGTSIDFTSIPSWVKRITVMFSGVSTNGTSNILIQSGSGSIDSTGYVSQAGNRGAESSSTAGFLVTNSTAAASLIGGSVVLTTLGSNIWTAAGTINGANSVPNICAGYKTFSGVIDRVRITTVGGTETFDAGTINIMYEG